MASYQTPYPFVPDPFAYRGIYPSAPYPTNYPLRNQYGVPYPGTAPYLQGMSPMSYADPGNQYPYDSNNFAEPHPNQQHPAGFSGHHPHSAPQPPHADYEPERTGRASTHDHRHERSRNKRTASRGRETKSASHKLRKRIEDLESRFSEFSSGSDSGRSQLDSILRALSPSRLHDSRSSSGSSGSGVGSDQLLLEVILELLNRDKRQRDRRALLELLDDPNVLDKIRSALWDMYGPDGPDDNSREDRRRLRGDQCFTETRGPRRYALRGPMLTGRTFTTRNRDNISRRRDVHDTGTGNQRRNREYQAYVTEVTDEDDLGVYEQ